MYDLALDFATQKHAGQVRRVTNQPYIEHPIRVSKRIADYKVSRHLQELQAAALLHDTLEDTDATVDEIARLFGGMVVSLVVELTTDTQAASELGKTNYLRKRLLGMSSYALVVKLCDRLDNVSDHPNEKMLQSTLDILDWLPRYRSLSRTHLAIIGDIRQACQSRLS